MDIKNDKSTLNNRTFNKDEFKENVKKGAVVGLVSTTTTFTPIDKPIAQATKASADNTNFQAKSSSWILQQLKHGNYSNVWNNSLYVQACRTAWQHPFKGYFVAAANSCSKNVVLFPAKYGVETGLSNQGLSDQAAKNSAGFLAGLVTVYLTTPISVIKARMMTDVPLTNLLGSRLMSGVNAIALRDCFQYGIYFNTVECFKGTFGDNFLTAGMAGVVGYLVSNPLSVVGLNQKVSAEPINMFNMAKQVYKTTGVKGFYPLAGLSALGMFARGVGIGQGAKLYEALTSEEPCESSVTPSKK